MARFRHVGLVVRDLAAAENFFCGFLGYEVRSRHATQSSAYIRTLVGEPGAELEVVMVEAADASLVELLCYHNETDGAGTRAPTRAATPGWNHISLTVDGLDRLSERASAFGVQFFAPPQSSTDGNVRVAYCRGVEGVIFERVELAPAG
jgi:glyoxylase I family protein